MRDIAEFVCDLPYPLLSLLADVRLVLERPADGVDGDSSMLCNDF